MLLRSSLPVAFWWLAVECAAYLLNRLPTKTVLGYMSCNNTPVARQQSISVNPDRVVGAPLNVPLPSSFIPGWNSQGRLATETPAETNLASEFSPPSKRGGRKRRSCVNTLPSLCLHVSCPQSSSQALKSPEVAAWKESIAAELHVLQNKRRCWEFVPY